MTLYTMEITIIAAMIGAIVGSTPPIAVSAFCATLFAMLVRASVIEVKKNPLPT